MVKKNEPKKRNNKRREFVLEPKFYGSIPPTGNISHYNLYSNTINQAPQNEPPTISKPTDTEITKVGDTEQKGQNLLDTLETIGGFNLCSVRDI